MTLDSTCLVFDHGKATLNCAKCKYSFSYEDDYDFTGCGFDLDEEACLREGKYSDA